MVVIKDSRIQNIPPDYSLEAKACLAPYHTSILGLSSRTFCDSICLHYLGRQRSHLMQKIFTDIVSAVTQ